MSKKIRMFWLVAASLYVVYHIATLIFSPLPWFDEVSFASMTESYLKDGTIFENIRIIAVPEQKLNYGPIYFMWQAFVVKTFGLNIFWFRISNLLFGFLVLYFIYYICKQIKFSQYAALLAVAIVAIEPNFNQFLHSGRMDFMCLSFFLASFIAFLKIDTAKTGRLVGLGVVTGVLLCLSMLTTPRIIFAYPVYVLYFLYEMYNSREKLIVLLKYGIIGAAFAAIYYWWIFATFGGISEFIYFSTHAAYLKEHLGAMSSTIRIRYNMFVYLFAFLSFALVVWKKRSVLFPHYALITLPVIVTFLAIVGGGIEGRYFALILPFLSITIAGAVMYLQEYKWLKVTTYAMAGCFALVFFAKGGYILATIPQHNPAANEKLIMKHIAPNSSVFGDFEFYYMARNKNCSYLAALANGTVPEITEYVLEHKTQYVILSKRNFFKPYYEEAFLNEHYEYIGFVKGVEESGFFANLLSKLPYRISDSYSCHIYKYKG